MAASTQRPYIVGRARPKQTRIYGKIPPTFNCRIRRSVIRRRRYNPRPRRIWDGIQCHRSHNGRVIHFIINCALRRTLNSSRGKGAGVGGTHHSIVNRKPTTPYSDSILRSRERVLHAVPARSWNSTHHQHPTPGPEPMDRTNDVSAAGTTPKKADPQQIPTGRPPLFQFIHSPNVAYQHQAPHTRHNNPWADGVSAEHAAKEDAEEQEIFRQPTPTRSNDYTICTIVLHVYMMLVTLEKHAQSPILPIICPTSHETRHTCIPTREK